MEYLSCLVNRLIEAEPYTLPNVHTSYGLVIQIMNNDTFVFDCLQACIDLPSSI